MKNDEVSDVTVSPGESLLLRCRVKRIKRYTAWARNGSDLDPSSLLCGKETEVQCALTKTAETFEKPLSSCDAELPQMLSKSFHCKKRSLMLTSSKGSVVCGLRGIWRAITPCMCRGSVSLAKVVFTPVKAALLQKSTVFRMYTAFKITSFQEKSVQFSTKQ